MEKRYGFLISLIITFTFGCSNSLAADYQIQTGFNYEWWESNNNDKGSQIYLPVRVGVEYQKFSFLVLTAFTSTESDPSGARNHSLSGVIDTKLNLSYLITDKLPVDIILGMDFNLPTGKDDLKERKLSVMMDPDLISIVNFGEGFNVNPTFSLAKEWENWAAGIGIGYLWRGEYDYSTTIQDYDPGNILSITGEAIYDLLPNWRAKLFCEYADYGTDEVDNTHYYQEGDFLLIGMGLDHYRTDWDASLNLKSIFRNKSKFQEGAQGLKTEDKNSYGDEWIADFSCRYYLSEETTLNTLIQFLWIDENDFSSGSPLFIGNREKISCRLGITRLLAPNLTGVFNINGFYMDDERNWYHDEDLTYKGFSAQIKLIGRF